MTFYITAAYGITFGVLLGLAWSVYRQSRSLLSKHDDNDHP